MICCRAWFALVGFVACLAAVASASEGQTDQPGENARSRVFRIHVVEEGTGRGVPLVELRTVNQIR